MANYQEWHLKFNFHFFFWPVPFFHKSFDDGKSCHISKRPTCVCICDFFFVLFIRQFWPEAHSSFIRFIIISTLSQSQLIDDQPAQVCSVKFDASYAQINKQLSCRHCSIPFYVSTNPQITRPIFIRGNQPLRGTGVMKRSTTSQLKHTLSTTQPNSHVSLE